jgi:hypothetical protein
MLTSLLLPGVCRGDSEEIVDYILETGISKIRQSYPCTRSWRLIGL